MQFFNPALSNLVKMVLFPDSLLEELQPVPLEVLPDQVPRVRDERNLLLCHHAALPGGVWSSLWRA